VVDAAQRDHGREESAPGAMEWIQYPLFRGCVKEVGMPDDGGRRERAEARLKELGDEPGGAEFLARMGVLGDWVVDFAFGDVHTRPVLTARERELIIVAVLATLGSSDPQVAAHIRALRAIDVPWEEIEETILQTTPYAGIPRAINAMKVLRTEQENEA
jgi:4-carboxymuconolactone decarboxylase